MVERKENGEKLEGGFINKVYKVSDTVIKQFDTINTVYVPADVRFQREVEAMTIFGGRISPHLLEVIPENLTIKMEYLDGETFDKIIRNGVLPRIKSQIYQEIGRVLKVIHEEPLEPVLGVENYVQVMVVKAWADLKIFEESQVPEAIGLPIAKLKDFLTEEILPKIFTSVSRWDRLSYTHGDYWSNNVLGKIEEDHVECKGVIDWEFFQLGVPEEDLAQVVMWEFWARKETKEPFEVGYGKIDEEKLSPFIILKLLDYMEGASMEQLRKENGEGFITNHAELLKKMI